ncbi:Cna B-type domain-containing protein [Streptococcus acidominimus]|nr:Cna B-type domain-containing protein [Streptococcus acidominimus]
MLVDFNFEGEWDASSLGASIQPGDFFTVPFNSKDSKIVLNNGSYALLNIDGTQLGTLSTSRNTGLLTFTFSNDIAGLENVRGTFKVKASARVSRGENHFTFPDGSQHTVNYTEGSSWSREPVINGENIYKSVEKYIQASGAPPELIQKLLAGEISIGEYKAALAQYSTTSMLWKVRINRSGGDYGTSNVTIRDSLNLTNGVVLPYKEDSFELNEVIYSGTTPTVVKRIKITTDEAEFISSAEDTALLILKDGKTAFELNLGNNVGTKSYELTYKTDVPEGGYSISNGITLYKNQRAMLTHRSITTGDQTTENTSTTTNASHSEQAVGGTITGDLRARIRITKYDAEDAAVLLAGASFKIAKTSDPSAVIQTLTTNKKGVALSNKLEPGEYFVTETTSPMGYRIDSISKKVIVSETGLTYLSVANTKGETDTPPATTEVSGTKTWVDNENQDGKRPEKLVVKLFKTVGGQTTEVETKEITSQNDWKYSFTNLPQFENGQAINYTIDEDVPDGYTKTVEGYHLTNTYEVEKTSIAVNKVWEDTNNQDGKRPEQVSVQLYADGQAVEGKLLMLNEVNNWRGSFDGLNKYKAGKVIAYTLQEVAVPAGYQSRTTGDMVNGFTITNSYSPATTEVSGTKTWVDNEDQDGKRPEKLVVKLFKTVGGQTTEVETKEITSQNDWKYSFTNLPQFENGQAINYTIDEDVPDGYTKTVEGYHLTNTYEVEKTSIAVNKIWEDTNNQDGKRPEQVSVQLYADGQAVEGKLLMLNEVNNWRGSFDGLNKYKAGKVIAYTLQEVAVPAGYQSRTTGDMVNGFTITNSYSLATTEVSGTKTWVDNENQDGKRPEKLVVKLFKTVGGQTTEVETKEITSQNDWKYSFTNLPQFENGQVINYTIDEDVPDGYTKTVEGYHLTNTYSPEVTEVSGTKNWDDANNQDGKRPDSITVHLLANGQKVASKTVTAADNWSYHFGNLAKYTAGQLVTYAIVEEAVSSYQARVDGYDLTNSYSPEMIDITVHKNWEDGDNQDGKRPSSITVHLLANGERVDSQMLQPDAIGNWSIRFTNKPKYANGQAIRYTVEEVAVEEYSTKIEDFTITNSYTPKEISYQVTKKWADKGNQDGKRPNSITVQLYKSVAGGEPVAVIGKTLTLTAADQTNADKWIGSFTKLPQFEKGQEITYSVREDEATLAILAEIGYLAKVEGQEIVNSRSPEMIRLSGSKVWDDANDQDGKRPASIVLVVKDGQGTEVERITVTPDETGRWSFESKDLPKYAAGKEVSYSVEELVTAEYTASITATDNKYTITNSYTPKKISIKGSKIWNDANNKDGIRPSSITVHLFANGVDTGKTATVSEATGWNYSFEELDQYQNGQSIQYTVQEDEVSGYTTQIEGTLIINSHVPKELTPVPKEQLTDSKNPPIEDKSGKSKPKKSLPATNSNMSLGLIALGLMLLVELGIYVMKRQK